VVDTAENLGPVDRLFHLLLAMTGRVDDDAINTARELLGGGQPDAAAEFLVGCLAAGQIPVSSTEQYQLRRVLDEVRSHYGLADRLHVVESMQDEKHRFGESDESDARLIEALTPVAGRLGGVRGLWCTWRTTPAGVTYGAVPRRVLLAEVGPDGSVAAVGYQVLEALRRAGVACSVDVFGSGTELPEYHRNALAAAHPVHLDLPDPVLGRNGSSRPRASRSAAPVADSAPSSGGGHDLPSEPTVPERRSESEPPVTVRQDAAPVGMATPSRSDLAPVRPADGPAETSSSNMRVPAAVDARLTDRERTLLRKLHEELAQREQDRDMAGRGTQQARRPVQADARGGALPGTGGFPPISAASSANHYGHGGQQAHSSGQ
jgi:hypothetical protein